MDASPFGKLSGELRNQIYEYALQEGYNEDPEAQTINLEQGWFDCPFHRSKVMNSARTGYVYPLEPLRFTGLPLSCKSIRKESLRLYYSLNRFTFETEYMKSRHQDRIVERLVEWTERIGCEQAREIRDVTISLAALKGATAIPSSINWDHMRLIKDLFHPKAVIRFQFFMDGLGTATFTLARKERLLEDLEKMADLWCTTWQRSRKYDPVESRRIAQRYKQEVEELFVHMPEEI